MPELPEIETLVRGLAPVLRARRIAGVAVHDPRLRTRIARDFAASLTGRCIVDVRRHGKFMLVGLDDGRVWLVHLGMSGRLTLSRPGRPDMPHDHVVLRLDDGRLLTYNDPRRFGRLAVVAGDAVDSETAPGLDALSGELTADFLHERSRRHRRATVKAMLMDQREVAGLGNIYVNEALFRAGIRPMRRFARLKRTDVDRIAEAVRWVLRRAIDSRGSSLLDYRDADGNAGEFQRTLRVYDRAGEPCVTCGTSVRRRVLGGRSSFYCPTCQR